MCDFVGIDAFIFLFIMMNFFKNSMFQGEMLDISLSILT